MGRRWASAVTPAALQQELLHLLDANQVTKVTAWTNIGRQNTPQFPLEGMVTRHLSGPGGVIGFEMSTPGLRGQSGGPAFDAEGRVWGIQAATAHLDLNFDVDMQVVRQGVKKPVKESAILHVGHCMHVDVLKDFVRSHKVTSKKDKSRAPHAPWRRVTASGTPQTRNAPWRARAVEGSPLQVERARPASCFLASTLGAIDPSPRAVRLALVRAGLRSQGA